MYPNKINKKPILKLLEKQFGIKEKLNYTLIKNNENKLFIVNNKAFEIDQKKLRINSLGLYFATIENNELRLSIEATQMFGKKADKNILNLNEEQLKEYMLGKNITVNNNNNTTVILKYKDDFIGCAKQKDFKVINFLPKERRVQLS